MPRIYSSSKNTSRKEKKSLRNKSQLKNSQLNQLKRKNQNPRNWPWKSITKQKELKSNISNKIKDPPRKNKSRLNGSKSRNSPWWPPKKISELRNSQKLNSQLFRIATRLALESINLTSTRSALAVNLLPRKLQNNKSTIIKVEREVERRLSLNSQPMTSPPSDYETTNLVLPVPWLSTHSIFLNPKLTIFIFYLYWIKINKQWVNS